MVNDMKNCFLIVNYNDYKSTLHLVNNIKDFTCLDVILIIDNNSNEKEKERLKTIGGKNIEILFNDSNMGYSSAINIGSRHLIEKYGECNLIVSNSDIVILSEDDLVKMIDILNDKKVGLVGPQLLELGNISRGYKNAKPLTDIFINVPIVKNFISEKKFLYEDEHYEEDTSLVDVISSSFFLISSDTLQRINFMDENIFLYYEDFILAKKVSNLGLSVVLCNNAKVKHLYSVSVDKSYLESDKYKLLKDSQFYYQTTYNGANGFERILMRVIKRVGLSIRKATDKKNR